MGSLYPGTSVSGFNANPPPDDGTLGANNQITWSGIKSKIGDPINVFATAVDANITAAFNKTVGGAALVSTAVSYAMTAADQGRLISASASGITITTPDATVVHAPFCFAINNATSGSITLAGFGGTQNVDGQTTQTILSGGGCIIWTDGANWFSAGLAPSKLNMSITPQGRLTLTTGVPVMTASATGSTTVYYSPYSGLFVPIYNGTVMVATNTGGELSQLTTDATKSPAAVIASKIYDVFVWNDAGTIRATRGPPWTSASASGTGAGTSELQLLQGIYTNKQAISNGPAANRGTYVGSISSGAGSTIDWTLGGSASGGLAASFNVWNMYNRVNVGTQVVDTGASYTYTSATPRQARASTGNQIGFLFGLQEDCIQYHRSSRVSTVAAAAASVAVGVGFDTTSAFGFQGSLVSDASASLGLTSIVTNSGVWNAGIGTHILAALESGDGANANTVNAGSQDNLMAMIRA